MGVTFKVYNDILIVNLKGELDHHMARIVNEKLDEYLMRQTFKKILFNFKHVNFMDSSGVGMLIGRYKSFQKIGGKVGAVNLGKQVRRIFEISGLFNIIPCYNDEIEASEKM
ncbi:Anti-sigma F factor antagonist [Fervidicola ferrireducens]|uniref:Anti-sigma F factor antagonist n=1 Tax=Fervidicola ferrireducens TaxID=520764 RepID=A0A140LC64_9FIRM|nr:anti-sigma F factor antagonist [Fervidicola ferrireducens]KXG78139.1 Anti-sigma F factor antagonist [Fervidicola ferrireducens]